VAVIGMGSMGGTMAATLSRVGFDTVLWDRRSVERGTGM